MSLPTSTAGVLSEGVPRAPMASPASLLSVRFDWFSQSAALREGE